MVGVTVTRAHLNEALYEEVGLSRDECGELVETVLREISDTLTKGEAVKISSFGSFSVRQKGERIGRNPKTGEEVPILPRRVVVFRASHVLKSRISSALTETNEGTGAKNSGTEPLVNVVTDQRACPASRAHDGASTEQAKEKDADGR